MFNPMHWLMKWLPGPHKRIFSLTHEIVDYIESKITEHRETLNPSIPRDYIDSLLIEMEEKEHKDSGYDLESVCFSTLDLFGAGSETITSTLHLGRLFMIFYPHKQDKVQAEIDVVVGSSRQPSMTDIENMTYSDDVIHEIQRMGDILSFNVAHTTNKDTKLDKYTSPKRFSFRAAAGEQPCQEYKQGATYCPKPYCLSAVPR